jgi:adenylate cyclase
MESPEAKIISLPVILRGMYALEPGHPAALYAFEVAALMLYKGLPVNDLTLSPVHLKLKDDVVPFYRRFSTRPGDGKRPIQGAFLINYRGSEKEAFAHYSFIDVVEGKVPKDRLSGRIVIIANTLDPNDRFTTTAGTLVFGGEIHAYALRTLLEKDFIIPVSGPVTLLCLLALTSVALLIMLKVKNRPLAYGTAALVLLLFGGINLFIFSRWSIWLPFIYPVLGPLLILGGYVAIERYSLHKTLGSLLPASFMKKLDPLYAEPVLGGSSCWATVLFADIRGYTNLSESLPSVEVMNMLNEYHEFVKKPIHDFGGEIFDYQGDAYMVVFGACGTMPDHAGRAVKTAVEIARLVEEHRDRCKGQGKQSFEVGIGLCTGEVAVGYVGHSERALPAAIGDPTNVAARLQGKSSELKTPVLLTETTWKELDGSVPTTALSPVQLKGKKEPLLIFTIDWEKLKENPFSS